MSCRGAPKRGAKPYGAPSLCSRGTRPIVNLAAQLFSVIGFGGSDEPRAGALYGQLRLGGLGLVETVRSARLDAHTRVLVVVDQFEEIFRFRRMTDADEASAFVKLLLNAANDRESPVTVVITLRSDTLGYCDDFSDLPETISRGQYLVPKLTRGQRKEAIVGPIDLRGFQIAPRLVQRLLNDVSDAFDDLPVMQHALSRTWNRWAEVCQGNRPIDLEDYEAVGTDKDALSRHADEAFESLSGLGSVVEKVFRALTERVAAGAEVRRALGFDMLCHVVGADRGQVEQVVERFRRPDTGFLRPGREIPLASNPVIDISHESLIRQWPRLRKWAEAEAKSRETLERLVHAATRRLEPNPGSLWRGRELEETLEWRRNTNPTPAWAGLYTKTDGAEAWKSAESFLAESVREVRRERWRGRWRVLVVAVVAVLSTAAFVGFKLEKQAKSRELANKALLAIEQDPARSAHLALVAVDQDPANESGVYALRQSLATLEVAHAEMIRDLGAPISDVRYTRDGSFLVIASGKTVTIFDSKEFKLVQEPIAIKEEVQHAWLINDNKMLVTQTVGLNAQIQRIDGSDVRPISCEGEMNPAFAISVSPDDRHVALGCYAGEVLVWDATEPAAPKYKYSHKMKEAVLVTALTFSSDGKYLASGDALGAVNLWKLGYPTVWLGNDSRTKKSPIKHELYKAIRDIAFSSHLPGLIVTAGDDNQAIVWDVDLERRQLRRTETKQPRRWPLQHKHAVVAARFTVPRDDKYPLVTISGKNTQLWESPTSDAKKVRAHDDWVTDVNASTDGEWLVTASSDGTARIWSTRSGAPIAVLRGHRGQVNRAVFSPDGKLVVTASTDGSVRIWQFRAPRIVASSDRWALSARFEPKGTRIAVSGEGHGSIVEVNGFSSGSPPVGQDLADLDGLDVAYLSWSKNGKFLLGIQSTNNLYATAKPILWDAESKKDITPRWFEDLITATFSPRSDELLTVNRTGQIAVWDMKSLVAGETSQPKLRFTEESGRWMATMSPDGRWIAALNGNYVELWKREDPQSGPRKLMKHKGDIKSLQFSPDSQWLLTASVDRTALLWPVDQHGIPKELKGGHAANLASASFDPSGTLVVTGSADSTIRVWEAETAKQLASLRWHSEGVTP